MPKHKGLLFTEYFLVEGIKAFDAWRDLTDDKVDAFVAEVPRLLSVFNTETEHNEADTAERLIFPVIKLLGWEEAYLREQDTTSRDKPDALLFGDAEKLQKAQKISQKYRHAVALLENKRWQLPLDRREEKNVAPSSQIMRYLDRLSGDAQAPKWGILSNGHEWRQYYQGAYSRAEEFFAINLPEIIDNRDWTRVFMLVFSRSAFLPDFPENRTFHQLARDEGKNWEQKITNTLSTKIFEDVFPLLARTLAAAGGKNPTEKNLQDAREAAMVLLYRLLFVLYAEDRNLLPVQDKNYYSYSLRKMRDDIEENIINDVPFSEKADVYFALFEGLCKSIDAGDKAMQLPPYNGGLFQNTRAPLLSQARLSDKVFSEAVDTLSRQDGRRINYHDLSVRHLGAMYERFLEQELYLTPVGHVAMRLNAQARRDGGSYYTPDDLVRLIIERAVGVLLDERTRAFDKALKQGGEKIKAADAAAAMLQIKVCDPAMGSGHFLVALVDYLADRTLLEMAKAAEIGEDYESPLAAEMHDIRTRIHNEAKKGGWTVREEQLEDRMLVRRIVLKKVVYGVDKNPMAVELAKLSLWLHTFTVGAPLTFLDHHLRCGDSLFGEWTMAARDKFAALDCLLEAEPSMRKAEKAAASMTIIEGMTDSEISEVQRSQENFSLMREQADVFEKAAAVLQSLLWLEADDAPLPLKEKGNGALTLKQIRRDAATQLLLHIFNGKNDLNRPATALKRQVEELSARESFMHWESAFPGVWRHWSKTKEREGGFDAVIGNPPWDRMKMQEVEWFIARQPEVSRATTAAQRWHKINQLRREENPIIDEYDKAAKRASTAMQVVRDGGQYPQLGGGDVNLYSLFVERALSLVAPNGVVGLLTPSGICGDKTASLFFRGVVSAGRLATIIDFENRKNFFPEVHRSFKFCVFVLGGDKRKYKTIESAFYLHDAAALQDSLVNFKPGDFALLNPNTQTAPVFRNQRDAEITLNIYRRLLILHKHGKTPAWSVDYMTMFHMAGDSALFQTAKQLEEDGFYRVADNHYKRGQDLCLPLYVGRMIYHFNHRANSVRENLDNMQKRFVSESTTIEQLCSPSFCAEPQFWVEENKINNKLPKNLNWILGFRNITNPTNERTIVPALLPRAAVGHSMPLLLPILPLYYGNMSPKYLLEYRKKYKIAIADYKANAPLFVANMSSFALDFIARQKMQGTNLTWFIVKQLPVILPAAYAKLKFDKKTAADIVREHVLRLCYTADDMSAFARDMNYKGTPFIWDEENRRHWRARLDALYFILYGINCKDAAYIMDTFLIVKRKDEGKYGGYISRDLILAYMNALDAGDAKTKVKTPVY